MDCIIKQLVNSRKDLARPLIKPHVSLTDPHKAAIRQTVMQSQHYCRYYTSFCKVRRKIALHTSVVLAIVCLSSLFILSVLYSHYLAYWMFYVLRLIHYFYQPCYCFWSKIPPLRWARASSFTRVLDHIQVRITVGRTTLEERSARRIGLYLTKHNTYNRFTYMPLVGFEPTIAADERPQTYALDRAVTVSGLPTV